jgi:hypothetical protein
MVAMYVEVLNAIVVKNIHIRLNGLLVGLFLILSQ